MYILVARIKNHCMINIINQLFEIEKKCNEHNIKLMDRNISRMYVEFEEMGYVVKNPLNETYDSRDTSVEATLINEHGSTITKVLKPIIFEKENNTLRLVQKGIVIVE